jgi:uncharacterized repeat protein (TIGR03803 family)
VLYVAAYTGGSANAGTIFKYDIASNEATVLYTFSPYQGTNGTAPSGLTFVGDTLYGTTVQGGTNAGYGILFKISLGGSFTKLRDCGGTIGNEPTMPLCASSNLLYGSTQYGGANNVGALFCVDTNGTSQWIQALDGTTRNLSELVAIDGYLYSASYTGGAHGDGSIVRIKKDGTGLTNLFSYAGTDGAYPNSLTRGPDGQMYGTTRGEYGESASSVFVVGTNGVPTTLTTIEDSQDYFLGLSFGPNGLMYAVTAGSGISGNAGRIYQIGTNGSSLRLVTFPYRSPSTTNLYVSPITFGDDNQGYLGFRYTNAFGRLSFPQWTALTMRLTCSNTVYTWPTVVGQSYTLKIAGALNGQWTNYTMVATNGISEYVSAPVTNATLSEFGRVIVYTTNTLTGFDAAMTNGAVINRLLFAPLDQRDASCRPQGVPCTNNCPPPSGPPELP